MKLHLPSSLFRALFVCVALVGTSFAASADSVTYTSHQNGPLHISGHSAAIIFENIQYAENGAAIYQIEGASSVLSFNDSVSFRGNTAAFQGDWDNPVCGGAICNNGTFRLSYNADVTISGNTASAYAYAYGGAIYNVGGTFELSGNGDVTFSGNTATASSDSDSYAYAYGGAIYNFYDGTFTLSDNGGVTFSGNTASASGGAIYNFWGDTFTLSDNGDVTFSGNTAYAYGGAIYNDGGTFELSGNGDVTFSGNTATASSDSSAYAYAYGGAIYNYGSFTLSGNDSVTFSGNTATASSDSDSSAYAYGGAIYNIYGGTFTLSDNGDVTFSGNTASAYASASGGAIYNFCGDTFTLSDNGDVSFSGNTATASSDSDYSAYAYGGAIYNIGTFDYIGTFELSGNGDVTFSGNTASASSSQYSYSGAYAYGGAIYNHDYFELDRNGAVTFSGNTATASSASVPDPDPESDYDYIHACGGAIFNGGTFTLSGNDSVTFSGNTATASSAFDPDSDYPYTYTFIRAKGGAIANFGTFTLSGNDSVTFSGNTATGTATAIFIGCAYGGAIYNEFDGTFELSGNGDVTFSGNTASYNYDSAIGGAIYNYGSFTLSGNDSVTFSGNTASGYGFAQGGAIYNDAYGTLTLSGNGDVTFSGNTAYASSDSRYGGAHAAGGAIFNIGVFGNIGTFELSGNGDVTFSGNTASASSDSYAYAYGGAIYNEYYSTFTLSGNGDVLFEKNAEVNNGIYRLRSIYSCGTLNLSASEGKSILFKDSVYASGAVNLNPEGTGDIVFSGISTEADLREVKGGVDGTAEEILNSRTSEIATNASLYGGRLIVEDGAILKGQGITVTEGANATIRLKDATLNEAGYAIAVSAGSGLEFESENLLSAASVQMADGAFLSFVMGEGAGTNWDAQLITGLLNVKVSGDLFNEHRLLTLSDVSQYDTTRWTSDAVTVTGAGFDSLSWADGVLTYTPHVITPDADGSLDESLPDDGNAVIDGNGHTLTVKNEVQLVQMALKNGTVKLEGENNGIVSVTLTEDGELVLTAGAGLKTGDIISMVASGKGELHISGDITLDSKGLKGKAGAQATVSHADAQVLGDATISNVRVEDSVIDLAEGSTVGFDHVVLAATTRITDDPATANLDDVTAELVMGVNASLTGSDLLLAGTTLAQSGNTGVTLTLSDDASVLMLEATTFDSVTLTGTSLVLELAGMDVEIYNGAEWIAVSFTSGTDFATFDSSLAVTLSIDGICYESGYTVSGDDSPTTMYFRGGKEICTTPEPATATLSLLALAALAARRKRK